MFLIIFLNFYNFLLFMDYKLFLYIFKNINVKLFIYLIYYIGYTK